jgi:hypothetical protein
MTHTGTASAAATVRLAYRRDICPCLPVGVLRSMSADRRYGPVQEVRGHGDHVSASVHPSVTGDAANGRRCAGQTTVTLRHDRTRRRPPVTSSVGTPRDRGQVQGRGGDGG